MNHPRPTPPPAATGGHRAVPQDTTVTAVDRPVCQAWTTGDPDFTCDVTVLGAADTQRASTSWRTPTDPGADEALDRIGWHRTGPWEPGWTGRTGPGTPVPPGFPGRRPPQPRPRRAR